MGMEENIVNTAVDDLQGRFLTFYIDQTVYGLELFNVIEIVSIQDVTRIPSVPDYIKGIINLRGKVVPIIDVRLKLKQPERAYDEKTCIIVVVIDDMQVGLIVDRVSEVVTIGQNELADPPSIGNSSNDKYLQSIATVDDKIVLNIDCNKFFYSDLHYTKI